MHRTLFLIAFSGCFYITSHPDSYVEEIIEDSIESATGLDIDLSSDDGNRFKAPW